MLHERPVALEEIGADLGGLGAGADYVGQGGLHDGVRGLRALGGPVAERGAEAVRYGVAAGRPVLRPTRGHAGGGAENTSSPRRIAAASRSTSSARPESGTRCSRFAFMRSAGMVQTAGSRSISFQVAASEPSKPNHSGIITLA